MGYTTIIWINSDGEDFTVEKAGTQLRKKQDSSMEDNSTINNTTQQDNAKKKKW